MEDAVTVPCGIANVPVYRNIKNELVSYSPDRKLVIPSPSAPLNASNPDGSEAGIYPKDMVQSWLKMAFLQHLSKHAYSVLSHAVCHNKNCVDVHTTPAQLYGFIGSAVDNMQSAVTSTLNLGIDFEKIGRRCSIAVCIMVSLYVCYSAVTWFVRYALFKNDDIGCLALIVRATCPGLFLITKATEVTTKSKE